MLALPRPFGGLVAIPKIGAAEPGLTVALFDTNFTSNGDPVPVPAGTLAGDFIVCAERSFNIDNFPPLVVPDGFTQLVSTTAVDLNLGLRVTLSYKISDGTETELDGGFPAYRAVLVFRPSGPINSVNPSTFSGEGTANEPSDQTIEASEAQAPVLALASYNALLFDPDPRGFTIGGEDAKDGELKYTGSATSHFSWVAWKIFNSSPQDILVFMEDERTQIMQSGYIALS